MVFEVLLRREQAPALRYPCLFGISTCVVNFKPCNKLQGVGENEERTVSYLYVNSPLFILSRRRSRGEIYANIPPHQCGESFCGAFHEKRLNQRQLTFHRTLASKVFAKLFSKSDQIPTQTNFFQKAEKRFQLTFAEKRPNSNAN